MFGYTYLQRFHDTKFRHFRYHKTSTKATKKKIVALLSPSNQPINNDGDDGGGSGGHPKEWHVAETQTSTMLSRFNKIIVYWRQTSVADQQQKNQNCPSCFPVQSIINVGDDDGGGGSGDDYDDGDRSKYHSRQQKYLNGGMYLYLPLQRQSILTHEQKPPSWKKILSVDHFSKKNRITVMQYNVRKPKKKYMYIFTSLATKETKFSYSHI